MRGHLSRGLAVVAAVAALIVTPAVPVEAAPAPPPAAPGAGTGRLLVTFAPGVALGSQGALHRKAGALVDTVAASLRTVAVDVRDGVDVDDALAAYRSAPGVEWAGVETEYRAMAAPDDNAFPLQWNLLEGARGSTNWSAVYEDGFGAGVIVAVVDTGVGRPPAENGGTPYDGFEHELVILPGSDFVDGGATPYDEHGHGTFIAGTIAQQTGNATTEAPGSNASVAGIAPDALIMPVRVLASTGGGLPLNTALGIQFATDRGARVINLSLGGDFVKPVCDAVKYAVDRGVVVVAASGNESSFGVVPVSYPAGCPGAIAVGGHRFDGTRGSYSNASCELALTAPGGDLGPDTRLFAGSDARNGILQETWDPATKYGFFLDSGTSMATAHAAGAAAVLLAPPFNESPSEAARILRATTRDTGPVEGADDESGSGALDIAAAVQASRTDVVPPIRERLGYWMVASDGGIFSFGDAPFFGSTGNIALNSPIVGMARTGSGRGYWMVAADGGIFTFGDAPFYGSTGAIQLASPIIGMAPYPNGKGYWLVAKDGGIFSFHDPAAEDRFFGSTGGIRLNSPIVGMSPNRSGNGYWLFAADGGVFAFNSPSQPGREKATFHGSAGGIRLNAPIVAGVPTPTGQGYWLVATDGGIFSYGDAAYLGSTGDIRLNQPIVGMTPTCYGRGYWLVARDGGIFAFGAAPFRGSTGAMTLNQPIVGMTLAADQRASQL